MSLRYFVITLFLVAASTNVASSLDLICEFVMDHWHTVGIIKTCYAKGLNTKSPQTYIEGVDELIEPANDVKGFFIENEVCHYVPKRIAEFFPGLIAFGVQESGLKHISKSDLEHFPGLIRAVLRNNELDYLEGDLFAFNRKLKSVSLADNKLKFVSPSIFENLQSLNYADIIIGCFQLKCDSGYKCAQDMRHKQPDEPETMINCKNQTAENAKLLINVKKLEREILAVQAAKNQAESRIILNTQIYEKLDGQRRETFAAESNELRETIERTLKENNDLLEIIRNQSNKDKLKDITIERLKKKVETLTNSNNCFN